MSPATSLSRPQTFRPKEYAQSLAAELGIYRDCLDVHNLPAIFHYWSNRHILPALNALGVAAPAEMFARNLEDQFRGGTGIRRFASLGAGNCDFEIAQALRLREAGRREFVFDCVDLNPAMLERGRLAAKMAGVLENFAFVEGDFNAWRPREQYHAITASQSLHHVVSLEDLFGEVKRALRPGGAFIVSDIIGRNGHLRWPEALDVVREFWRRLPPSYRWNRRAGYYEEIFADHDCSGDGFEGVRSQDILPLLADQFHFRFFFPFGNVIDPFIDRSFGPNFDPARECDRAFIDRVHLRDLYEMTAGRLKPCHMLAVMGKEPEADCIHPGTLSPDFCMRSPDAKSSVTISFAGTVYRWRDPDENWPQTPRGELEKACARLAESAKSIQRQTAWALSLERDAKERLDWGESLNVELEDRSQWGLRLEAEVKARTAWALGLNEQIRNGAEWIRILESSAAELQKDMADRTLWAQRLERELEERTRWAFSLRRDLEEQRTRADLLDAEIHRYMRNPLRLLVRMAAAVRRRIVRPNGG